MFSMHHFKIPASFINNNIEANQIKIITKMINLESVIQNDGITLSAFDPETPFQGV